jgi:hypothetical protein
MRTADFSAMARTLSSASGLAALTIALCGCGSSTTSPSSGTDAGRDVGTVSEAGTPDSSEDAPVSDGPEMDNIGGYRGSCGSLQCVPGACGQLLCVEESSADGGRTPWCGCAQYFDGNVGSLQSCGNLQCGSPCTCTDAAKSACSCP